MSQPPGVKWLFVPLLCSTANYHSKETGHRLLEARHEIKTGILSEKLTCNHSLYVSLRLSNDQKNLSAQKKSLPKCLSIYGR